MNSRKASKKVGMWVTVLTINKKEVDKVFGNEKDVDMAKIFIIREKILALSKELEETIGMSLEMDPMLNKVEYGEKYKFIRGESSWERKSYLESIKTFLKEWSEINRGFYRNIRITKEMEIGEILKKNGGIYI